MQPNIVEAGATVVAASAAIGIPLVLAWKSHLDRSDDARRIEALTMRELAEQWQRYNLEVAGSDTIAAALSDPDFEDLTVVERQQLHIIFFKLTAFNQMHYALDHGCFRDGWGEKIIGDLARTVFHNPKLIDIALESRGYSDELKSSIRYYDPRRDLAEPLPEDVSLPRSPAAPTPWHRERMTRLLLAALIALALLSTGIISAMIATAPAKQRALAPASADAGGAQSGSRSVVAIRPAATIDGPNALTRSTSVGIGACHETKPCLGNPGRAAGDRLRSDK